MAAQSRSWLIRELWNRPLKPAYADEEELKEASAVIAVPFNCYLWGDKPDESNKKIAEIAYDYMRRYNLPFFGQFEQTSLMNKKGEYPRQFQSHTGERVQSQRLVAWQAKEVKRNSKNRKVVLVGMPEHLGRVATLCEYFGLEPLVPRVCEDVPYDPSQRPGTQQWCTSRETFSRYERRIARPGTIGKAALHLF